MKIRFTDLFVRECEKKLGIRRQHVRMTVEKPDKSESVKLSDDWILEFRLKSMPGRSDDMWLLVYGRVIDEDFHVLRAFKTYSDLIPDFGKKRIAELLAALANRFGWQIEIAGVVDRFFFFHQAVFPLDSEAVRTDPEGNLYVRPFRIVGKKGREFSVENHYRVRVKESFVEVDYALAYCLDLDSYRDWLRSHAA